jgi:hypothetical protein
MIKLHSNICGYEVHMSIFHMRLLHSSIYELIVISNVDLIPVDVIKCALVSLSAGSWNYVW